jgi:asparagine synthase (glutamine-hydrolysing)
MKPLHILGLEVKRFPPGKILLLSTRGDLIELAARYWPVPENTTFTDHDGSQLLRLLESSVKRRIANRERIAISFSGGVDSSLLALIAKKYTSVVGITVGSENSIDQLEAKKYADLVGIDLVEVRPTFEDVRRMLGVVRNLAEVSSVMDLSIALAFYLSAKAARDAGCDKMFVGQLADELFGGYARYIKAYCNGNEDVERMMNNDVLSAGEKNIERDEKSTSPFVDLEIPYSSLDLVNYALRCPLESKFNCSRGIGKAILRKAAMTAGMPEQIALKPKKAIQYSSGLNKLVSRLSP